MKNKIATFIKDHPFGTFVIFWLLLFFCVIFYKVALDYFGTEKINSFFEKSEYTAKYYVNLFSPNSESKNYRVIAEIKHFNETVDYKDDTRDIKVYSLERIYWPNGETNTFQGRCYLEDNQIFSNPRGLSNCVDDEDNEWRILLNAKVSN